MANDVADWTSQTQGGTTHVLKVAPADSGQYAINDANLHTFVFPLPAGAKGFRFIAGYVAGTAATAVRVTGDFSAVITGDYINHAFGVQSSASLNDDTRRLVAGDQTLTVTVQLTAGSATFMLATFGDTGDVVAELGGNIGVFDGFALVTRSSQTAAPAPWQAARVLKAGTVAVTVNTDFTILAAPGGNLAYRLFDMTLDTNSGSVVVLQLWDGASANGVQVGEFEQNSQNNRPMKHNGGGAALGTNHALVGFCTFIAAGSALFFTVSEAAA